MIIIYLKICLAISSFFVSCSLFVNQIAYKILFCTGYISIVNDTTRDSGNKLVCPLGIVQGISIWPNEQMVYAQPNVSPGEWLT